ncbi:MAG: hypothetical protein N3A69_15070, partial [Leptospiraceae bacterium]|nr:hypothetical protein [Leptospiraceae bacterium]
MQYIFNQFMKDWVDPIRKTISSMNGLELKLYESGDPIYAGYSIIARAVKHIFISTNFLEFLQDNEKHLNYFFITKNQVCYSIFAPIVQSIKCLAGQTLSYNSFSSKNFDEEADSLDRFNNGTPMFQGYYCCYKLLALFYLGFYEEAGKLAIQSYQYIPFFLSMLMEVELKFYIAVSLLSSSSFKKRTGKKYVKAIIKAFKKYSELQPENYLHKYLFLLAEKEKAKGNNSSAIELFIQTADVCAKGGYALIEAKSYERLSELEESRKNMKLALFYLSESYSLYKTLGAEAKIKKMLEEKEELKKSLFLKRSSTAYSTTLPAQMTYAENSSGESTNLSINQQLDYETMIKSSHRLSAEIDLKSLLNQLLDILITNAGATKGMYFSVKDNQYTLEVIQTTRNDYNEEFPRSILQNVLNKKVAVVVNNIATDIVFNKDNGMMGSCFSIVAAGIKSILDIINGFYA